MGIINLIFFISSDHVRNIHFPFDIEVDTSTDVASEMVEELDLTDHDVSVIASMIDSEIRSHIPDWEPKNLPGKNHAGRPILESVGSGAQDDDLSGPGVLELERFPSGRKYWSDSPKVSGGSSPLRPGPSKSVTSCDSWSDENFHSPVSHKDVNTSYDASPLRHAEYGSDHDGNRKHAAESVNPESQFSEFEEGFDTSRQENIMPSETDSDDLKSIVKKLEDVMDEQLKELDELKKKHELAVLDLLKELPEETRQRVLSSCNCKLSEHKFHH